MVRQQYSPVIFVLALVFWLGHGAPQTRAAAPVRPAIAISALKVADSWSWTEFFKFWIRQANKTSGVLGIVLLVGLGAILLILSKSRG